MHREAQIPDFAEVVGDFSPLDLSLPTLPLCTLCLCGIYSFPSKPWRDAI